MCFIYNQDGALRNNIAQRCRHDFFFSEFMGIEFAFIQTVNMAEIERAIYFSTIF
ncbi:Uncharacterised protein [Neisseria meningitidis]|nr:Uncharacterised protein [Neisseria meningitidis]